MKNPSKTLMGKVASVATGLASLVGCAPQENNAPDFDVMTNTGTQITAVTGAKAEQYGVDEVYEASLDQFPLVVRAEEIDGPELIGHVEPYQTNPPVALDAEVSRLNSGEGFLEWMVRADQTGPVVDGERQIAGMWASDMYDNSRPSIAIGTVVCGVGFFYNFGNPMPQQRKTAAIITNIQNHEVPPIWEEDDGKCDNALGEPYSSPDCSPTTQDLVKAGHIKAYFADSVIGNPALGQRIDTVTTNPATFRIWVSNQLNNRLVTWPTIDDPIENGQSDRINIRNSYSSPQLTGSVIYNGIPGVSYDTKTIFDVFQPNYNDEVAGFTTSATTKDGDVIKPVIGSAFVPRTLLPYTSTQD